MNTKGYMTTMRANDAIEGYNTQLFQNMPYDNITKSDDFNQLRMMFSTYDRMTDTTHKNPRFDVSSALDTCFSQFDCKKPIYMYVESVFANGVPTTNSEVFTLCLVNPPFAINIWTSKAGSAANRFPILTWIGQGARNVASARHGVFKLSYDALRAARFLEFRVCDETLVETLSTSYVSLLFTMVFYQL